MACGVSLEKTWQFIQAINDAVDDLGIETALTDTAWAFGYTSIFGGVVPTRNVSPRAIPNRILMQRLPREWAGRYNRRGYVFRDPIVERLQADREPFSWTDAYKTSASRSNVRLIQGEAAEFGLVGGFVVPIALLDGSVVAMSFGGPEVDLDPDEQSRLGFAANCAVGALLQRRCSAERARGRISGREYDCLLWAAEGKTDWEISVILGVSRPTVSKHMLSAREKLGAVSRSHAIAMALREKIIR